MSEGDAFQASGDQRSPETFSDEGEVLDGVPVLSGAPRILSPEARAGALAAEQRSPPTMLPAVQAAAVAAGGFVAGAAVVGLVHRRRRHALVKGSRARRALGRGAGSRKESRAGELLQIVGSRSLLLDVHLLGGAGADR